MTTANQTREAVADSQTGLSPDTVSVNLTREEAMVMGLCGPKSFGPDEIIANRDSAREKLRAALSEGKGSE